MAEKEKRWYQVVLTVAQHASTLFFLVTIARWVLTDSWNYVAGIWSWLGERPTLTGILALFFLGLTLFARFMRRRLGREIEAERAAKERATETEEAWHRVEQIRTALREAWKPLRAYAKAHKERDGLPEAWLGSVEGWANLEEILLELGEALKSIPPADRIEHERMYGQLWLLVKSRNVSEEPERYFWKLEEVIGLLPTLRRQ